MASRHTPGPESSLHTINPGDQLHPTSCTNRDLNSSSRSRTVLDIVLCASTAWLEDLPPPAALSSYTDASVAVPLQSVKVVGGSGLSSEDAALVVRMPGIADN